MFCSDLLTDQVAPTLSRWGKMAEADTGSLWWAFHFVNDWVARKYSLMVGDVNKMQAQFQDAAFEKSQEWEERALKICSPVYACVNNVRCTARACVWGRRRQ
jgi:dipeptidase